MSVEETILVGRGEHLERLPAAEWRRELAAAPEHIARRLDFMTPDHHRVRYFAVRELPRHGRPLPPALIADRLGLEPDRVEAILEELERRLFFLVRDPEGAVSWAFPVTAETTPHRLRFRSGETLYAA